MHNSRARIALSMLTAALGTLMSATEFAAARMANMAEVFHRPRGWRNPFAGVVSTNRFTPHQGAREMARRRGGSDWLGFRNADRANRGLPALEG